MQMFPAKFSFDMDQELSVSDADHEIVDAISRGICEVYFDRSGSPPDAIVMISADEVTSLQKELDDGFYKDNVELEKTINAMLDYAKKNPAFEGKYCFVCSNY